VHGLAEKITQEAVAQGRHQMEAVAEAELTTVRTQLQTDLAATRADFETVRTALETQLAETERDISAIRQKRDEYEASLDQTRERIAALEEANGQATLLRQLAEARVEEEVQRRVAIEKQLEARARTCAR
jgi:predicted  nucleic acid-binding Zn-ribbon protein